MIEDSAIPVKPGCPRHGGNFCTCYSYEPSPKSVQITEADVRGAVWELFMTGERQTEWLVHEDLEGNLVNSMSKDEVTARLCDLLGLAKGADK